MLCWWLSLNRFSPKGEYRFIKFDFCLKENFGLHDHYLGANAELIQLEDGHIVCTANYFDYLKSTIDNVNNSRGSDKASLKNYGDGHRPY